MPGCRRVGWLACVPVRLEPGCDCGWARHQEPMRNSRDWPPPPGNELIVGNMASLTDIRNRGTEPDVVGDGDLIPVMAVCLATAGVRSDRADGGRLTGAGPRTGRIPHVSVRPPVPGGKGRSFPMHICRVRRLGAASTSPGPCLQSAAGAGQLLHRLASVVAVAVTAACAASGAHSQHYGHTVHYGHTATCQNAQLKATVTNLSAATGQLLAEGILGNVSTSSCRLYGYPRVTFADAAGRTTGQSRTTRPGVYSGMLLGRAPAPASVTLAPKASAVFWISWSDNPVGHQTQAGCVTPVRELVSPPGGSHWIVIPRRLYTQVCGKLVAEPVERPGYSPNPNQLTG